jgi:uncharacterized membrane protein YbhN (UPF0104 family)
MNGATTVSLEGLPTWLLVVGGILAIAQMAFELWALVDMLKRPEDQLALGGRKWLWAIIILFVNWLGAILYFAIGRKPASGTVDAPPMPSADNASMAVDSLYGTPRGGGPR